MSTPLQLDIPVPCHENWEGMSPSEKGRHCASCQKTVVDFTAMSDPDIIRYMSGSKAGSHVCGRLAPGQLNRPLIPLTPPQQNRLPGGWPILLAGLLFTVDEPVHHYVTKGMVVPLETQTPKPTAVKDTVMLPHAANRPPAYVPLSDTIVMGALAMPEPDTLTSLEPAITDTLSIPKPISIPGDTISPTAPASVKNAFKPLEGIAGAIICIRPKKTDTLKKMITDTLTALRLIPQKQTPEPEPQNSQLTVYPNPVRRGAIFRLAWQTDAGKYQVSLFSPAGALIQEKVLDIATARQMSDWQLPTNVPAGIYIIRAIRLGQNGVYARELVVQ